jgi:heme/copper-type cytochrome/quinol oxidase subunit 2
MRGQIHFGLICAALLAGSISYSQTNSPATLRIIELTADRDSRYRQSHKTSPTIEVSAGELLILRITAVRADQVARDGSVHGLALLDKNSNAVPGWRFFLRPGVQDLAVTAPSEPGRYTAVCTVICSEGHEGMGFTLLVTDPKTNTKE